MFKSFEVLAKITVPFDGERSTSPQSSDENEPDLPSSSLGPMTDAYARAALARAASHRPLESRDREVFAALVRLYARHPNLLSELSRVVEFMCTLQPPDFVFVSFALELDRFANDRAQRRRRRRGLWQAEAVNGEGITVSKSGTDADDYARKETAVLSRDLQFISSFVRHMNSVLLKSREAAGLRDALRDSVASRGGIISEDGHSERGFRLFQVLLHAFAHNLVAALSLCLWVGAYHTASLVLAAIDPLDIDILFYLEVDEFVELLERPLFRHLHLLMLEVDTAPDQEGSGAMLFRTLKSLLMLIPQSTSYDILRDRLTTVARFRRGATAGISPPLTADDNHNNPNGPSATEIFVARLRHVRRMHCDAKWRTIRAESLEPVVLFSTEENSAVDVEKGRRKWLGYANEAEEAAALKMRQNELQQLHRRSTQRSGKGVSKGEIYDELKALSDGKNGSLIERQEVRRVDDTGPFLSDKIPEEGVYSFDPSVAVENNAETHETNGGKWKGYWADN